MTTQRRPGPEALAGAFPPLGLLPPPPLYDRTT